MGPHGRFARGGHEHLHARRAGSRYVPYVDDDNGEPRRRRLSGILITVVVLVLIAGVIYYLTRQ